MAERDDVLEEHSDDASHGRGVRVLQVLVVAVIGLVSAVQLATTLTAGEPVTWRTGVQAFLALAAPPMAVSRWRRSSDR